MYELREEYLNYKPKTHQLQMQQTKKDRQQGYFK